MQLEASKSVSLQIGAGRQAYVLCVEGSLAASDGDSSEGRVDMVRHDAAEVRGDGELRLAASADAPSHVLIIEMAHGAGGRGPGKWPLHME